MWIKVSINRRYVCIGLVFAIVFPTLLQGRTKTIDTAEMSQLRKCVRPITAQSDNESRKLWQHVSENLKKGDIDTATQHKRFVSLYYVNILRII